MKNILFSSLIILGFCANAKVSNNKICSSYHATVKNGNIALKSDAGNIYDIVPVKSSNVLSLISETHKACINSPKYSFKIITVEEVVFEFEENAATGSVIVLCDESTTCK